MYVRRLVIGSMSLLIHSSRVVCSSELRAWDDKWNASECLFNRQSTRWQLPNLSNPNAIQIKTGALRDPGHINIHTQVTQPGPSCTCSHMQQHPPPLFYPE